MDMQVVKNAVGSLERLLSQAKRALRQIEREVFGDHGYGDAGGYEKPREAMKAFLEELHDVLLVILEAADMPETRASLINAWSGFDREGLDRTENNGEFEFCESPALTFLGRMIRGLRMSVTNTISSEEAWTLSRLEAMLDDTAVLVHRRGKAPADELELQGIAHDYLRACFPDFTPNPPIGGTLKKFIPDCGIRSVGAAIEFKIVHTKEQVAVAFDGIAADVSGYRGSRDWTRFYAVFYQAQPFMSKSEVRSELKRIGATGWTPIVVNGPTGNRAKKTGGKAVSGRQILHRPANVDVDRVRITPHEAATRCQIQTGPMTASTCWLASCHQRRGQRQHEPAAQWQAKQKRQPPPAQFVL
jgi:hypothetical protein